MILSKHVIFPKTTHKKRQSTQNLTIPQNIYFLRYEDFVIVLVSQDWRILKRMDENVWDFQYDPQKVPLFFAYSKTIFDNLFWNILNSTVLCNCSDVTCFKDISGNDFECTNFIIRPPEVPKNCFTLGRTMLGIFFWDISNSTGRYSYPSVIVFLRRKYVNFLTQPLKPHFFTLVKSILTIFGGISNITRLFNYLDFKMSGRSQKKMKVFEL